MKTHSTLFIISIGYWFIATYQLRAQPLQLDVMFRYATTNLRGNAALSNSSSISFITAGAGIRWVLHDKSALSAGLIYDKKGSKQNISIELDDGDGNVFLFDGTATSNFSYLTLPVRFNYQFGNKVRLELGGGFYTAFLLKQELRQRIFIIMNITEDQTDFYKRLDFGLSGSVAIVLPAFERSFFRIGVENNLGLMNVSDVPVMDNGSIRHNSFNAVITWTQVIGK
ncbi:MAG: PorT family protein [Cyclobacteriaceae bacterium]|nr:PorT family protein [Cyclobacteriaceae bacterium]